LLLIAPWIVLVVLCAIVPFANAQTLAPESEGQSVNMTTGQVVAIEFQGNHAISSDELATVTTTKVTGGLSRFVYDLPLLKSYGSDYQSLSITALNHDTASLNRYYQDHGFINARCSYVVRADHEDLHNFYERIRKERLMQSSNVKGAPLPQVRDTVIFTVKEGPPFKISRVAVEGLESLPNQFQTDLNEKVTIKSGQRWSRVAAATEIQRLINILIENGYPNARSDTIVVQCDEKLRTANVLFYFHPGHRYRYGKVNIQYDTSSAEKSRVADAVILSQLYIDSGHWYKLSEIQRSEAALNKLGTFDLFRISLDTNFINHIPDSARDSVAVPVEVYLRMKQRWGFSPGIFGGESSQNDLVFGITAGLTNTNFFQNADNVSAQLSWQFLPTSLTRLTANLDYTLPYIGLGHIPLIMGLGTSKQVTTDSPAYTFYAVTAHMGTNIVISTLDNRTTVTPDFLIAYDSTQTKDSSIRANAPPHQVNLIPSVGYQNDRTNDLINPTSGYLHSASVELGIPTTLLNSPSSAYLKGIFQLKYLFDLSDSGRGTAVIATHIRAGASYLFYPDSDRAPSLDRRFYGGGATSNRGWPEQSLLISNSSQNSPAQGGYNDLEANIEFRFAPFQYPGEFTSWQQYSSPVRIVLFYDIGNVWDNVVWKETGPALAFKMMAQTIGFGLRYNTFFGALRVDWGFKLYDPSGEFDNPPSAPAITPDMTGGWLFKHKFFSIGNTSNFHFGIGQAF
jgi:outer membrane protein assembly factor BamA